MRLRFINGSPEQVEQCPVCYTEEKTLPSDLAALFGNDHPVRMEIGMGKGQFIMAQAAAHPECNFIGVERCTSILIRAIEKYEEQPLENLRFLCADAVWMGEWLLPGSIDRLYLNFSDPWPKERHRKRRLTYRSFLRLYAHLLREDGILEFKTDNRPLFEFSLSELEEEGWPLLQTTFDLYGEPGLLEGNIPTEYEERFSAQGCPIHKVIARRPAGESGYGTVPERGRYLDEAKAKRRRP